MPKESGSVLGVETAPIEAEISDHLQQLGGDKLEIEIPSASLNCETISPSLTGYQDKQACNVDLDPERNVSSSGIPQMAPGDVTDKNLKGASDAVSVSSGKTLNANMIPDPEEEDSDADRGQLAIDPSRDQSVKRVYSELETTSRRRAANKDSDNELPNDDGSPGDEDNAEEVSFRSRTAEYRRGAHRRGYTEHTLNTKSNKSGRSSSNGSVDSRSGRAASITATDKETVDDRRRRSARSTQHLHERTSVSPDSTTRDFIGTSSKRNRGASRSASPRQSDYRYKRQSDNRREDQHSSRENHRRAGDGSGGGYHVSEGDNSSRRQQLARNSTSNYSSNGSRQNTEDNRQQRNHRNSVDADRKSDGRYARRDTENTTTGTTSDNYRRSHQGDDDRRQEDTRDDHRHRGGRHTRTVTGDDHPVEHKGGRRDAHSPAPQNGARRVMHEAKRRRRGESCDDDDNVIADGTGTTGNRNKTDDEKNKVHMEDDSGDGEQHDKLTGSRGGDRRRRSSSSSLPRTARGNGRNPRTDDAGDDLTEKALLKDVTMVDNAGATVTNNDNTTSANDENSVVTAGGAERGRADIEVHLSTERDPAQRSSSLKRRTSADDYTAAKPGRCRSRSRDNLSGGASGTTLLDDTTPSAAEHGTVAERTTSRHSSSSRRARRNDTHRHHSDRGHAYRSSDSTSPPARRNESPGTTSSRRYRERRNRRSPSYDRRGPPAGSWRSREDRRYNDRRYDRGSDRRYGDRDDRRYDAPPRDDRVGSSAAGGESRHRRGDRRHSPERDAATTADDRVAKESVIAESTLDAAPVFETTAAAVGEGLAAVTPGAETSRPYYLEEEDKRRIEDAIRRKKEMDEARRDDLTVLVLNLPLKASEREVWKFFSESAGKVRDIQLIRDSRSGRSKGVGYVEFFTQDAVMKALALTGQIFQGMPVRVQASQAEKNRAAKQAKQQAAEAAEGGPMKLYVGGLTGPLDSITENELMQLFTPFGDVTDVDLQTDPYTGKSRGYAYIAFKKASEAREAMQSLNGFEIAGGIIKVGSMDAGLRTGLEALAAANGVMAGGSLLSNSAVAAAQTLQQQMAIAHAAAAALGTSDEGPDTERLDDEGGGLVSGASSRLALMQKLSREDHHGTAPTGAAAAASNVLLTGGGTTVPTAHSFLMPAALGHTSGTTTNLVLHDMYTREEAIQGGMSFFEDIVEDVASECDKGGTVVKVLVDKQAADGKVYVKLATSEQAMLTAQKLQGRFFGGRQIRVESINDSIWSVLQIRLGT